MANYPKELTDLLQQYMTDGVMTDKERAVLLRKAESLGVDKDEFDLYIDAEVQKFDQKIGTTKRRARGKLCPFCEASVPMFTDKCPECGGNITPEVTKELNEIIEALEDAVVNFKSTNSADFQRNRANVERYVRKAEMYYGNNKKVQILVAEVKKEIEIVEKRVSASKRKENTIKFLTSPWFWVFVEVLVTTGLYAYYNYILNNYGYDQDVYDFRNIFLALGIIAVIATSVYGITRKNKD